MPTYPYLLNDQGWTMDHRQIKEALGLVGRKDGQRVNTDVKIHANSSTGWKVIQGVRVCYLTSADARIFWKKPGSTTPMRALAICPECGKTVAASRINQHARVHHGGERRGY
jgi:hypothetical protein